LKLISQLKLILQKYKEIDNQNDWHGKPLGGKTEASIAHVKSLMKDPECTKLAFELLPIKAPTNTLTDTDVSNIKLASAPNYKLGQEVATRKAYGNGLVSLGKNNPCVVALDGDVKNSTYSIDFKNAYPERFVECFIAEQNLAGVAIGVACRNRSVAFASTFAAVFYPSDAVSCERAIEIAANTKGVCYIRTSRPNTPVIYTGEEEFKIGQAKLVTPVSDSDVCTIVAGGITLHEAIKAANQLRSEGVNVRVVDVFCVKPLDWQTILDNAKQTNNRVLTVEDHYASGIEILIRFHLIDRIQYNKIVFLFCLRWYWRSYFV